MNHRRIEPENLQDYELSFVSDRQLLESQAPLPTRTMPAVDVLTDGMRGVSLLRGAPNGVAGILAVQLGVDAVVNNPSTCLVLFRYLINRSWISNHIRWHSSRSGESVLQSLFIVDHSAGGTARIADAALTAEVARAKRRGGAGRAVVIVDDLYQHRKPPKRRTWTHRLLDDSFTKRLRDVQRESGDAWVIVADHDMQGEIDRIIECATPPISSNDDQVLLTIRGGDSRDVIGKVVIEYDKNQLRFRELTAPLTAKGRSTS